MISRVVRLCPALAVTLVAQTVEFQRDVRPILSDNCYACHGPDAANRGIKLRLDSEAGAKGALAPGQPDASELIRRITSTEKAKRMPPVFTGRTLNDQQISVLRRWVEQGAKWQMHWAYVPPKRPAAPDTKLAGWARNPVDSFVLARLEKEGLQPSPAAPAPTLIRRVSLDLTGLPPTPAEVDAFVKDKSPQAYEKVVDRLLASPRYAEKMTARWLDAARYADTNGYQTDGERDMWRWRDWVLEAFQRNVPFDQFTIEQIAGDQLPNPTTSQLVATGFNRNHRGNGEGGIVSEEYLFEYVADRVETTATVWMGTTLACTRCHSHKYDPFSQKEFYQLAAYFNNIPERGRYFKFGNTPPLIPAPTAEQRQRVEELDARLAAAERRFASMKSAMDAARKKWEGELGDPAKLTWLPSEALAHATADAGRFDGSHSLVIGDKASFGYFDKFTLAARIYPEAGTGAILTRVPDEPEQGGYGLYLKDGKVQVNLVQRWLDDSLRVETERTLEPGRWYHVAMTYDGSRWASGIQIYVDGKPEKLKVIVDELNQEFRSKEPLRIGGGYGADYRFHGRIQEARAYSRLLAAEEIGLLAGTGAAAYKLEQAFLAQYAPAEVREAWADVLKLRREREKMVAALPTVMIMQDRPEPRDSFLHVRGAYDKLGEKVSAGVPAVLNPLAPGTNNRLALGKWLVSRDNPLTARVIVNRFWQMYFGTGIVKTVEDFGSQGEFPSHPELLDWLASEFMDSGWNVKALQKTIVMSAAYRQSSRLTPELLQRDPENRLLARGPRLRLSAETVRDQALAVSGLLTERTGGPSVKPYQPEGLWKELSGTDYVQDHGEKLYRRSLYTYWRRTAPPPSMMNFDAAGRETCIVQVSRTNTPLQALNLMNDVQFLEASRFLGQRMIREGGASAQDRLRYGFRLATARTPEAKELAVLERSLAYHRDRYATDKSAAAKLLAYGEGARDTAIPEHEHAAYMTVASMILNLDEVVTKE